MISDTGAEGPGPKPLLPVAGKVRQSTDWISLIFLANDLASTISARKGTRSIRGHHHRVLRGFSNERLHQGFKARVPKRCDQVKGIA